MKEYRTSSLVIAVPVYNEEAYLRECLESIRIQTCGDFIVVIGDNRSSDRSPQIAQEYVKSDNRFFLHRHCKNIGAAKNFEFLYKATQSEFFMWIGAHDKLSKNFIDRHIRYLRENPDCALSCSKISKINESGLVIGETSASNLGLINHRIPSVRYFQSVVQLGDCTAVNHPFRRDILRDFSFPVVASPDHIILSRILFFGRINQFSDFLYHRRYFCARESSAAQRLVGLSSNSKDVAFSHMMTKRYYIADFICVSGYGLLHLIYVPLLSLLVDKEFSLGIFRVCGFLRKSVKNYCDRLWARACILFGLVL